MTDNVPRLTRRKAMFLFGALPFTKWATAMARADGPTLAPGAPMSAERMALIQVFESRSRGLDQKFEKRVHKGARTMPYRLFRPEESGKLPLVLYLHGSGGLGDDNEKQLGLGNVFGTRVWALPDNQRRFPCHVLAPQTDRGWADYKDTPDGRTAVLSDFGEGNRLALEIVDALAHELPIDQTRVYVMGQSMGGAGVWNMIAHRPKIFAAAVPVCAAPTPDELKPAARLPIWAFHGDADKQVPVAATRERVATLRNAGGHPIYTEYAGVDHNVWEWAFTEPALPEWLFGQRRPI